MHEALFSYIYILTTILTKFSINMEEHNNGKKPFSLMEYFLDLLHRFMKKIKGYEEDKVFFEDDKNLYNEDGTLTPAYEAKIKEYERYALEENMSDFLKQEEFTSETDAEVIDGISDFTTKRHAMMVEYSQMRLEKGQNFDPYEWVQEKVSAEGLTPDEKNEKKNILNELIEQDNLIIIDDSTTKEGLSILYKEAMKGDEA